MRWRIEIPYSLWHIVRILLIRECSDGEDRQIVSLIGYERERMGFT